MHGKERFRGPEPQFAAMTPIAKLLCPFAVTENAPQLIRNGYLKPIIISDVFYWEQSNK